MLLLHLSDIHFRLRDVATALDPNNALRAELVRDAVDRCGVIGQVPDAILISGDIAYAGKQEEYEFADAWLETLAQETGTALENIVVIPGNHDVDRTLAGRPLNATLHRSLQATPNATVHQHLLGLLLDPQAAAVLYEPLGAYNRFAQRFLCDLNPPDRTRVFREFPLNDGSRLRVWGLNSAFISSAADRKESLFFDSASLQISRQTGTENLVMIHHPPDWLRDGQMLRDALDNVTRVQLFGHEHVARVEQHRRFARVRAGAAHPDRDEPNWEPGYNLVEIDIEGRDDDRTMVLKVHARGWRQGTGRFHAIRTPEDEDVWMQRIVLEPWSASANTEAEPVIALDAEGGAQMTAPDMRSLRKIAVRFFALTLSRRSEIVGRLGLLEEADVELSETERMRNAILRAHERGVLADLEAAIKQIEEG